MQKPAGRSQQVPEKHAKDVRGHPKCAEIVRKVCGGATVATPSACYRGPKAKKCPKWLGEGAKGLLGQGHQSPLALVQKRVAPVQNRA